MAVLLRRHSLSGTATICAKTNKETVIERTGMCLSWAQFYLLCAALARQKTLLILLGIEAFQ